MRSATLYSLATRVSSTAFGMMGFFLMIRYLDPKLFGEWTLFITSTALLETVRNGLVQNGFLYYLGKVGQESEKQEIRRAALWLNAFFAIASVIVLIASSAFLLEFTSYHNVGVWLILYAPTSIALVPFFHHNYNDQSKINFKRIFWRYTIRQGGIFIVLLAVLLGGLHLNYLVIGMLISTLIAIFLLGLSRSNTEIFNFPKRSLLIKLFTYGRYSLMTNGLGMLFHSGDRFSLGILVGPGAVGIYAAAAKFGQVVDVFVNAVGIVTFSKSCISGKDKALEIFASTVGRMFALLLPLAVGVMLVGESFLNWVSRGSYNLPNGLLALFMLATLFYPITRQYGIYLDSTGSPQKNAWMMMIAVLVNFIVNFSLIPIFGLSGAVASTLLVVIGLAIFIYKVARKSYKDFGYILIRSALMFYPELLDMIKSKALDLYYYRKKLKSNL